MEGINLYSTPSTPVKLPKSGKNPVLALMSLLLIVLVGIVIFLAYQNYQLQKQIALLQSTPTPTLTPSPIPITVYNATGSAIPSPKSSPVACTQEAKLCPNGSSVGRTGPNCEFAPCPTP